MNHLLSFLSFGRPCFPEVLSSGDPVERHVFMELTVERLAAIDRPLRVLEIGSWLGFSALTWAECLARRSAGGSLLCVDPWSPYHTEDDARSLHFAVRMDAALRADIPYQVFLHNIDHAAEGVQIDHFRGRGRDVLPYLQAESFDIVYIDGSHYYDDVVSDLQEAQRLTRSGGLICGDDLERQIGDSEPERGIRGVSEAEALHDDGTDAKLLAENGSYHPGVSRAVAEVFGRVSVWDGYWAVERGTTSAHDVALEPANPFVPRHFGPQEAKRFVTASAGWTRRRQAASPAVPTASPAY